MKRIVLAALAAMVLAGPAGAADKLKFAVVPKAMNNLFFDLARDGCIKRAKSKNGLFIAFGTTANLSLSAAPAGSANTVMASTARITRFMAFLLRSAPAGLASLRRRVECEADRPARR